MVYLILTEAIYVDSRHCSCHKELKFFNSVFSIDPKTAKKQWKHISFDFDNYSDAWEAACHFATGVRHTGNQACIGVLEADFKVDNPDFDNDKSKFKDQEVRELKTYVELLDYLMEQGYEVEKEYKQVCLDLETA